MTVAPELNYRWDGQAGAPVLLLAHSIGTSLAMWEPQVSALAAKFHVLRYDHRGHAGSPVPPGPYRIEDFGRDVIQLLDRLGLDRVSFCGLSLGGMVGMWLGAHAPERIDRLVLCCTTARMMRPEDFAARAVLVRKEGMGAIADGVIGRWFTPKFAAEKPEAVDRVRRIFLATPAEGYAAGCEALAAMDLRNDLARIGAPTTIIAAADDHSTPVAQSMELASRIRNSTLIVIEQAAHLANIEQPEAVTERIIRGLE